MHCSTGILFYVHSILICALLLLNHVPSLIFFNDFDTFLNTSKVFLCTGTKSRWRPLPTRIIPWTRISPCYKLVVFFLQLSCSLTDWMLSCILS